MLFEHYTKNKSLELSLEKEQQQSAGNTRVYFAFTNGDSLKPEYQYHIIHVHVDLIMMKFVNTTGHYVRTLFFLFCFFSSLFLSLASSSCLVFSCFACLFIFFFCVFVSFSFRFLLFSFLSFTFFSFLGFFSPNDLRLSCVCVVIDTTCNIYSIYIYIRGKLSCVASGFSRRE